MLYFGWSLLVVPVPGFEPGQVAPFVSETNLSTVPTYRHKKTPICVVEVSGWLYFKQYLSNLSTTEVINSDPMIISLLSFYSQFCDPGSILIRPSKMSLSVFRYLSDWTTRPTFFLKGAARGSNPATKDPQSFRSCYLRYGSMYNYSESISYLFHIYFIIDPVDWIEQSLRHSKCRVLAIVRYRNFWPPWSVPIFSIFTFTD